MTSDSSDPGSAYPAPFGVRPRNRKERSLDNPSTESHPQHCCGASQPQGESASFLSAETTVDVPAIVLGRCHAR